MMFASINWLEISISLLLVVFVVVCLLMTLIILMQRPKQEGLGAAFGANVTDQVFGARTTNVLQRGTVYLGSLFFVLAMTLSVLVGMRSKPVSMLSKQTPVADKTTTADVKKLLESQINKALQDKKPVQPAGDKQQTPPLDKSNPPTGKAVPPTPQMPTAPPTKLPAENKAPAPAVETPPATKPETPAPTPQSKPDAPVPVPASVPVGGDASSPDKKPSP